MHPHETATVLTHFGALVFSVYFSDVETEASGFIKLLLSLLQPHGGPRTWRNGRAPRAVRSLAGCLLPQALGAPGAPRACPSPSCLPARSVTRLPPHVSFREPDLLTITYLTAHFIDYTNLVFLHHLNRDSMWPRCEDTHSKRLC